MKKKNNLFWLLSATLILWSGVVASAQDMSAYYTVEEMPDLIQCLPAPPAMDSPAFQYDKQRYKWGKQQRKNVARAEMAKRDAIWTNEALMQELSVPFGMEISAEKTPAIWKVVTRGLRTINQLRVAPKAYYQRIRPFVYYREPTLTGEDDALRGEGSYPSGHTLRATAAALLLAQVNPGAANAVFARAWEAGESRVIAGCHWQSDVDVTRMGAAIGYTALQNNPEFLADMAQAREEFERLSVGRDYFVSVTDVVPDAILEIRYFGTYNFVGERIDGYKAPTALLTKEAAAALKAVSDDVMAQGYRLKIYDAYRPQCAVDHFVRWAANVSDTRMKPYFYPNLDKSVLFEQEYIMAKSGHTRGSTVDLTLFDMRTEKEVDMGGTFDWFGRESHPDYKEGITPEQYANRMILREAMLRHGFKPLDTEWWHFTLIDEPFPARYFNFPVE